MELHFVESESAFSYFAATRKYIERHGKPGWSKSRTTRRSSRR